MKKLMQKQKMLWSMTVFILLTGCAEMNSQFDCPMKPGVRCESLDQVNARVDRGEIGHERKIISVPPVNVASSIEPIALHTNSSPFPLRTSDQVMQIWVAPYEDSSHNYHAASVVYTVTHLSHWIGLSPKTPASEI